MKQPRRGQINGSSPYQPSRRPHWRPSRGRAGWSPSECRWALPGHHERPRRHDLCRVGGRTRGRPGGRFRGRPKTRPPQPRQNRCSNGQLGARWAARLSKKAGLIVGLPRLSAPAHPRAVSAPTVLSFLVLVFPSLPSSFPYSFRSLVLPFFDCRTRAVPSPIGALRIRPPGTEWGHLGASR